MLLAKQSLVFSANCKLFLALLTELVLLLGALIENENMYKLYKAVLNSNPYVLNNLSKKGYI